MRAIIVCTETSLNWMERLEQGFQGQERAVFLYVHNGRGWTRRTHRTCCRAIAPKNMNHQVHYDLVTSTNAVVILEDVDRFYLDNIGPPKFTDVIWSYDRTIDEILTMNWKPGVVS